MSLCYDFEKWLMITFASVAISLTIGLLMQYAHGQEYNLGRIFELKEHCIISTLGVGDDYQPNATVLIKNEFLCKELVNYELSVNANSSIVSQDSNQIVINAPKNLTELNQSIEHHTGEKNHYLEGVK